MRQGSGVPSTCPHYIFRGNRDSPAMFYRQKNWEPSILSSKTPAHASVFPPYNYCCGYLASPVWKRLRKNGRIEDESACMCVCTKRGDDTTLILLYPRNANKCVGAAPAYTYVIDYQSIYADRVFAYPERRTRACCIMPRSSSIRWISIPDNCANPNHWRPHV